MKMQEAFQLINIKEKFQNKQLPIKTVYKFAKLFKELEIEINFFNETIQKTIEQYGKKDADGNYELTEDKKGILIQEDKYDECMKKINELNSLEINLSYTPIFKINELELLELSMNDIEILMPFIED